VNARDVLGITSLLACALGLSSIVKMLLHVGAAYTATGLNNETLLDIASQEKNTRAVWHGSWPKGSRRSMARR
jgi:hypothetical protein